MDNLENVLKACEIITAGWGLAISPRNVTVSTAGITPGVEKFLESSECNLTLSLHSPFTEERKKFVPVEMKYPAFKIIEIMKNYPVKKKRRLSLAYVMIKDLNDTDDHLKELKALLKVPNKGQPAALSSGRNDQNTSSPDSRMQFFKHNLVVSGYLLLSADHAELISQQHVGFWLRLY